VKTFLQHLNLDESQDGDGESTDPVPVAPSLPGLKPSHLDTTGRRMLRTSPPLVNPDPSGPSLLDRLFAPQNTKKYYPGGMRPVPHDHTG
jgi:hypothetical protein